VACTSSPSTSRPCSTTHTSGSRGGVLAAALGSTCRAPLVPLPTMQVDGCLSVLFKLMLFFFFFFIFAKKRTGGGGLRLERTVA
jgi:hypothetical protein